MGRSGGPSGQIQTRTQDGDLQSGTDRQGPWRSWELRRPWQMVFGGLGLGPLGPAPTTGTLTTPPKNFPGEVRGYQEPSGAKQTRQERPPGPDRQDRTAHRNQKPSWAGLESEASSGHDLESEAHTGSLSDRLHINDKGAGG